jgi:hypothetical protein
MLHPEIESEEDMLFFTLTMPVAPRLNDNPGDGSPVEQFSPRSVLIVEDNKNLADGVAELLRLRALIR